MNRNKKKVSFGIGLLSLIFACAEFQTDPANVPPEASTGSDKTYFILDTIWLDSRGSFDEDGDELTFFWMPPNNLPINPIVTEDTLHGINVGKSGDFTFTMMAFDGKTYSAPQQVTYQVRGADIVVTKRPERFPGMTVASTLSGALTLRDSLRTDTILVDTGTYSGGVANFVSNTYVYSVDAERTIFDADGLNTSTLNLGNVRNVTLKRLTITNGGGSDSNQIDVAGILCRFSSQITLEDCRIVDNKFDGIRLLGCDGVQILKSEISGNPTNGIRAHSSNLEVIGNQFMGNGKNDTVIDAKLSTAAIALEISVGEPSIPTANIIGNYFSSGEREKPGVSVKGTYRINMRDNVFNDVGICLYCDDGTNAIVEAVGNKFENNITPIFCKDADSILILRNTMKGSRQEFQKGIDLLECRSGTIEGNRVDNFRIGMLLKYSEVAVRFDTLINYDTAIYNIREAIELGGILDHSSLVFPEENKKFIHDTIIPR